MDWEVQKELKAAPILVSGQEIFFTSTNAMTAVSSKQPAIPYFWFWHGRLWSSLALILPHHFLDPLPRDHVLPTLFLLISFLFCEFLAYHWPTYSVFVFKELLFISFYFINTSCRLQFKFLFSSNKNIKFN